MWKYRNIKTNNSWVFFNNFVFFCYQILIPRIFRWKRAGNWSRYKSLPTLSGELFSCIFVLIYGGQVNRTVSVLKKGWPLFVSKRAAFKSFPLKPLILSRRLLTWQGDRLPVKTGTRSRTKPSRTLPSSNRPSWSRKLRKFRGYRKYLLLYS